MSEGLIYMVLEYGDIDLARLLAKHEQARREGGGADDLDENFIRLYWQQMLQVTSCGKLLTIVCCTHSRKAAKHSITCYKANLV